jgi:eukaryotic-like serine/threonine-protein kinase
MANLTAETVAQQALKLGLLAEPQFQECWENLDLKSASAETLLRFLERKVYLTPWQSQKLLKGENEGYFLGGYRLLYKIASGSFGRVFRADDPHTGKVVAIKVLRRRWSEEQRTINLFEREGKVGRSLQHPNIVSILAVDRDIASQQYYIVMDFVEGGNLRDFLAIRKKLEPSEALRLLEDAGSGLAHAFSVGITHRDLKPTNILISSQGAAKLVDFGLAGIYGAAEDGKQGKMYRTVDYAGLEKATGVKPGDPRSDIYFLGCVFFEMLTGKSPLDLPADPRARMKKTRFDQALTLNPEDIAGPRSVWHLLQKMTAYNPLERYQTPTQLLDAIREVRAEVDGAGNSQASRTGERAVFVVEKNARLQDALRDRFKKMGYRVFLAGEPSIALNRFRLKPFDALVLDAGGGDEESVITFEKIMTEASRQNYLCGGILLLSEDQAPWQEIVQPRSNVAILVRPVTMKQVADQLERFVPLTD